MQRSALFMVIILAAVVIAAGAGVTETPLPNVRSHPSAGFTPSESPAAPAPAPTDMLPWVGRTASMEAPVVPPTEPPGPRLSDTAASASGQRAAARRPYVPPPRPTGPGGRPLNFTATEAHEPDFPVTPGHWRPQAGTESGTASPEAARSPR
jgi:hypothetical protein